MPSCSRHNPVHELELNALSDAELLAYAGIHVSMDSDALIKVLATRIRELKQEIDNWRGNAD